MLLLRTEREPHQSLRLPCLKSIQLGVFPFDISKKEIGAQAIACHTLNQMVRGERSAPSMDLLLKPPAEDEQFTFCDFILQMRDFPPRLLIELRGVQVAEGVGGEVPEGSQRPMHILQNPISIPARNDVEILLHLCIPDAG